MDTLPRVCHGHQTVIPVPASDAAAPAHDAIVDQSMKPSPNSSFSYPRYVLRIVSRLGTLSDGYWRGLYAVLRIVRNSIIPILSEVERCL